ncbi:Uu.00g138010.m01.CDS01 [Anthostomella pinea]|uniref:Uu.00g138010.m01.CDS01 n=1 Tax=Anthostomella pinea TaxID=933095 RepID=A0AAI8VPP2_9PEZI|nr:Uu.00g138010.m01.CDS01 [Anthostomella pinea]
MLANSIIPCVAALVSLAASTETHGGYDFQVRFSNTADPETTDIKDAYEQAAAEQASTHLQARINATGIAADCLKSNTGPTPAELYALKDCVAADNVGNFFTLLADDIEESNTFWDTVVSQSTTDRTQWVPARMYTKAYFDGDLLAAQFAIWTQSQNADDANNHANPEHYYKKTTVTGLTSQSSDIFEGWGGVLSTFGTKRTNFTVPEYTTPTFGTADYPEEWAIDPSFLLIFQRIGPKVLKSGSEATFGALHIAVRDLAADEGDEGKSGIEVYAAVWYPPWDQASEQSRMEFTDNYLADEAHHMVVEVINLTLQAQKDCSTGLCVA